VEAAAVIEMTVEVATVVAAVGKAITAALLLLCYSGKKGHGIGGRATR